MTPYSPNQDVFQSQADSRFNSFSDPLNPVNMNPGAWGIDATYMTPSYMSPYRPRYQGDQGQPNMANPSFGQSMNYLANPFHNGGDNYGGNFMQQTTPFFDTLGNKPTNAAMSFAQNWVIPSALTFAAFKYLEKPMGKAGEYAASRFASGLLGAGGAAGKSWAVGAAGSLGGLAARWMGPLAGAQMAMEGINSTLYEPFIAQRDTASNFRKNFEGVTYGPGHGDPFTGGGISRTQSWRMAGQLSKNAAMDHTFNQDEMSNIADYSARSGLLDNANPDQMVKKISDISKQLKLVMAIANTSDFKESIELLAKLQFSGIGGAGATTALGRIGALAGAAGMSTQKMMNTVGMQGQFLFGSNGLTPGFGQIAAGQFADLTIVVDD